MVKLKISYAYGKDFNKNDFVITSHPEQFINNLFYGLTNVMIRNIEVIENE